MRLNDKLKKYDCDQFDLVNPTDSNYSFDLFNGWSNTPFPNTPFGFNINWNGNYPFPVTQSSYPQSVSNTYDLTDNSAAIQYIPSLNKLFVGSVSSGVAFIKVVNPEDGTVESTISTSLITNVPIQILYNSSNNRVYVINGTTTMSIIDCSTLTEISTLTYSSAIKQATLDTSKNSLYISVNSTTIIEYGCNSEVIENLITTPATTSGVIYFNYNSSNFIIVFSNSASNIYKYNTSSNTLVSTIATSGATATVCPNCLDTDKNTIYFNRPFGGTGVINEYDIATDSMLATAISIPDDIILNMIYVADYSKIYLCEFVNSNNVVVIDTDLNSIVSTVSVTPTSSLGGLVYDENSYTVYGTSGTDMFTMDSSLVPYIVGSTDYNQFIQSLKNDPKKVRQIILYVETQTQFTRSLNLYYRDANGNILNVPKLPNTSFSANQYQNQSYIDFFDGELVLDNNTIITNYIVPANSVVKMIIYYQDIKKSDLLKGAYKTLYALEIEETSDIYAEINERTEDEILSATPINQIPVYSTEYPQFVRNKMKK